MRALLLTALVSSQASAFCGFFVADGNSKLSNNASQVVLLRNGHRTVMTMSNNYQGPPENFAMVVPVPVVLHKEDVKTLPADVFDHIDALSAPRLVEYWEQDPCRPPIVEKGALGGGGRVYADEDKRSGGKDLGVKVEARFAVGEYEIVILSARDSGGLETWLHESHYSIPDGAKTALAPYIAQQMKFFVAKVNIQKVHKDPNGTVILSPLRFGFDSDELRLPVRLGLLNANGKQDLIVYILHPQKRFEAANYPNVFIPTNLEVADEVRKNYAAFYAELFDATLAHANGKAVVTEYAWQTSSCDPCPTPPLQASDLFTLGADVAVPKEEMQGSAKGGYYGNFVSWVLTRLHTRYDKATLSEDLIFREAKPMWGGRANYNGTSADSGAQESSENNFQGRYIIRHYWSGPVKCDHPNYDDWGGPPGGGEPQPTAARGLASAPRGKVDLKKSIQSPVPTLGIAGKPTPQEEMMRALLVLLAASPASAFCGFFVADGNSKLTNNASQVVLLRNGHRTVMTLSNNYQGPPQNFAMVVPVPVVLHKEDVKTLPADVFDHIDALSAPRLVEYWEQDPCRPRIPEEEKSGIVLGAVPESKPKERDLGVKVEARFSVGEYEIVILSARDSGGLETWLHQNHYSIPDGAKTALAPYIAQQMKFFVAKVNIQKVHKDPNGTVILSPLRFGFDSDELRLPVRLGLLNANGKQDLIIYILHPQKRFEAANYPNVFIPTNLEVADEVRKNYAAFYAELFDATLAHANGKAVVTEYAWQTSSCDPCPTPPLEASDLFTLGADIAVPKAELQGNAKSGYYGNFVSWVLTRLHTRYDKAALSEDLIFREAKPIWGGRANWNGTSADAGAQASSENNFQGRYIIRHYWSGPVKCDHPQYDEWGGPPGGGEPQPTAARGLASAPRGKVDLKQSVQSPVPTLGIAGKPPHRRK